MVLLQLANRGRTLIEDEVAEAEAASDILVKAVAIAVLEVKVRVGDIAEEEMVKVDTGVEEDQAFEETVNSVEEVVEATMEEGMVLMEAFHLLLLLLDLMKTAGRLSQSSSEQVVVSIILVVVEVSRPKIGECCDIHANLLLVSP
jgi:hypothetical protein